MNAKPIRYLLSAVMAASLFLAAGSQAQPFGQWDFNSSNLTATVGTSLSFRDGTGGATDLNTAFGTNTVFGIPDIAGANAIVMRFPAAVDGMGYYMPTPPANGGGSLTVNQYTFILDLLYPAASSGKTRPLIQTSDGATLGSQEFFVIDGATGGVGPFKIGPGGVSGPYVGRLNADTWYRLGIVVTTGDTTRVYTNGVEMGSFSGGAVDGFFALTGNWLALILADTSTNAALGYVNSIQLRDVALSAGQMAALGGPSAAGIPSVIPPVPSFAASRSPGPGDTGVSEVPVITAVIDQGDTTVNSSSIVLTLDGAPVGSVAATPPTYTVSYTVPPRLDPLSTHSLVLSWSDNVAGSKSLSWTFTVKNYQQVSLPAPFYFEDFESLTEDPTPGVALPAGWTVRNQTAAGNPGFNLDDRNSDSYKDWILVSSTRLPGWGSERTDLPTIVLNGTPITSLASGNLLWAESDQRCGSCNGQFSDLFTGPISCAGKTNVFVAFNSIYEQNQDNMDFLEYSVDGGASWLPALYYFDNEPGNSDIILTNGVPDVPATFARIDPDRGWSPDTPVHATNYGSYISAPVSAIRPTDIFGRLNDSTTDGKRIEVIRLPKADGQADVRFHFNANGTSAWFWGIDNFGLYEINAPVISEQPQSQTADAGTPVTFSVVAVGTPAPTYQWQFNTADIPGATTANYTFTAEAAKAGSYRVIVSNPYGRVTSSAATLSVISTATFIVQPVERSVNAGVDVTFNALARGRQPLSYQWTSNGVPILGATGTNYSILNAQPANDAFYACVISNAENTATSGVPLKVVSSISRDLVVHLKFDNNYTDSSGRGNNATAVNAPTFGTGRIGSALEVTVDSGLTVNNYATLGYPADLHFGTNTSFSIAFWTKIVSSSADPSFISNKDWDSGSTCGFVIATDSDMHLQWNYRELDAAPNNNTRKDYDGPAGTFSNQQWRHIVVVFNRGGSGAARVATYVDGNLVDVRPVATANNSLGGYFNPTTIDNDPPNARTSTATAVNIGEDGSGAYNAAPIDAFIDDLGIWRRALTPAEVLGIYTAGLAGNSLDLTAPVTNPKPLNPTITLSGANVLINKANTMLESAPSLFGPWAEEVAARQTNTFTAPATGLKYYRGRQP
ncbi:MAG TPA: LamG-like jellyroll fold domain-containing protein [Verrucomicrobiae bacterium]